MYSVLALAGDPDEVSRARIRLEPPDNEAPSAVGVSGVIARSADVAILVVGLARFTTGLQIDLAARSRLDLDPGDRMRSPFDVDLLIGVELADGRTAVAGRPHWDDHRAADEPLLVLRSSGGGGREWSSTLWLTPPPPPGDLVLVVAAPALGVDESSFTVDAEALRTAADGVEVLWPREPDQPHPAVEAPTPDVPPGGWFDRALAAPDADEAG